MGEVSGHQGPSKSGLHGPFGCMRKLCTTSFSDAVSSSYVIFGNFRGYVLVVFAGDFFKLGVFDLDSVNVSVEHELLSSLDYDELQTNSDELELTYGCLRS